MDSKPSKYTGTAIALHWIVAVLIMVNLAFGLYVSGLDVSPQKLRYISWHKWIGVTVLLLAAGRLAWRLRHRAPALPEAMPHWEKIAAHASHGLLYALFFSAPLTGWLYSSAAGFQTVYLGLVPIPDLLQKDRELAGVLKLVHKSVNYTMAALIAVHAAAAIKHHVRDRDDVLTRMLPFLRKPA